MTTIDNRIALICGVSGQDGCYLAKFLLNKGYIVYGTSRSNDSLKAANLVKVGVLDQIHMIQMAPENPQSVTNALKKCNPDEVYYLAGQSSVGLSFQLPTETILSISHGILNVLEACLSLKISPRIYHAGSGECFGGVNGEPASELTLFHPKSPYAIAQASAYWLVNNYRNAYGQFACTGILFNHESPLRLEKFVTQKIIQSAIKIANGSKEKLTLGNIEISRDWGWAPEYVKAMWLMLQQDTPEDFVISTGSSISLKNFVKTAFDHVGLNWENHVLIDNNNFRPLDVSVSTGNPKKAEEKLGWKAHIKNEDVVRKMIDLTF